MTSPIDPATTVGTATLSVGDLERSVAYYQQHIGLDVLERGSDTATLGVATRPLLHLHEVAGARLVRRATGLYHFALLVPSRRDLARVIRHFSESRTPVSGVADHIFSEALYLSDPDGHGIEIYRDRPRSAWYDANGTMLGASDPLDIQSILGELRADEPVWNGLAPGTVMGHIHLQVADIPAAERFYIDVLGMERMITMPSASFVSAGGYHHHVGMNTWAGVGVPSPPAGAARLEQYEIIFADQGALDATLDRIRAAHVPLTEAANGWTVTDPSHNRIVLRTPAA